MSPSETELSQILKAVEARQAGAEDRLFTAVYEELQGIARAKMARESPGLTLQPTALVHEAYLRLLKDQDARWQNRAHFFWAAATAMRRILVERARKYAALKHGGGRERVALPVDLGGDSTPLEVLALNEALDRLHELDSRKARVVTLRSFAGFNADEISRTLDISPRTVKEDWRFAKAWLRREISKGDTTTPPPEGSDAS